MSLFTNEQLASAYPQYASLLSSNNGNLFGTASGSRSNANPLAAHAGGQTAYQQWQSLMDAREREFKSSLLNSSNNNNNSIYDYLFNNSNNSNNSNNNSNSNCNEAEKQNKPNSKGSKKKGKGKSKKKGKTKASGYEKVKDKKKSGKNGGKKVSKVSKKAMKFVAKEGKEKEKEKAKEKVKRKVTNGQKKYVAAKQKWRCKKCDDLLNESYEVDHIKPLSKGGTNELKNLAALCRNCHGRKTYKESLGIEV